MSGAWRSDWQQAADEKAELEERLERLQRAFDYLLPYVHVDMRDKALQIAQGGQTPLEDYIGSLGHQL